MIWIGRFLNFLYTSLASKTSQRWSRMQKQEDAQGFSILKPLIERHCYGR